MAICGYCEILTKIRVLPKGLDYAYLPLMRNKVAAENLTAPSRVANNFVVAVVTKQ